MMRAVVERGTASRARALGRPAAGKTGTTNDNTDAWFIGFTGRVLAAVWIGFDDPATSSARGRRRTRRAAAVDARDSRAPRATAPERRRCPAHRRRAWSARRSIARAACSRHRARRGLSAVVPHGHRTDGGLPGQPGTSPTDFGRTSREF